VENRLGADEKTDTQGQRERQQSQIGDERRKAVQAAAVLASLDNAVIGTGRDQQADGADEEPQANPVRIAGICREFMEPFVKHPTKSEPEQDLGSKDQDPSFIERDFDLFRQLHA